MTLMIASIERSSGLRWTDKDILMLKEYYNNTADEIFSIYDIAQKLKRSFASVALKASKLGISRTRKNPRTFTEAAKRKMSESHKKRFTPEKRKEVGERIKNWHKNNKHPRGFLGKSHSELAKLSISKKNKQHKVPRERVERQVKTRMSRHGKICPNSIRGSWGAGWREIGGCKSFYRSKWEANYARYLDFLKNNQKIKKWEHEPDYFIFNPTEGGCISYLPDFKVINNDGSLEYHEVKGWWDEKSKIKSRLMSEQYPNTVLKNFDGEWYKENKNKLSLLVNGWEK